MTSADGLQGMEAVDIAIATLNRSSDTNLLDACVDDDDDDDEEDNFQRIVDNTSVDATGRQNEQILEPTKTTKGDSTTIQNTTITTTTLGNSTPRTPTATSNGHDDNTLLYTPKNDLETPPVVRRKISVSPPGMDGLAFDISQPWERSLLRQLEKDETAVPITSTTTAAATTTTTTKNNRDMRQYEVSSPMMLLGHTESRDFAMEYDVDDTVSLETSSSCPPIAKNMQFIHRLPSVSPQPRIVYHIPSSNDDYDEYNNHTNQHYGTAPYYYYHHQDDMQQHHMSKQQQQHPHPSGRYDSLHPPTIIRKNIHHPPSTSSLTNGTTMTEDKRDDEMLAASIMYNTIPSHISHHQQHHQHYYLEMEASTGGASFGDNSHNDDHSNIERTYHPDLIQQNNNSIPIEPGCFCLGYNMLEYIISSAQPTPTTLTTNRPLGKKQPRGVLRPVRLPRVNESINRMESDTNSPDASTASPDGNIVTTPFPQVEDRIDIISEPYLTVRTINTNKSCVEPEGTYLPHTEHYYYTTDEPVI
jgi:hypothetical protein